MLLETKLRYENDHSMNLKKLDQVNFLPKLFLCSFMSLKSFDALLVRIAFNAAARAK